MPTRARSIEPEAASRLERPEPRPPLELRPRSLSVTRVETLRRDPYAVYAQRILELQPMEPVVRELGARESGEAWHGALQDFAELHPCGALPPHARSDLVRFARARFALLLENPAFEGVNWPNIEKAIDFFLDFEHRQRGAIDRVLVERHGEIVFPLSDGAPFKLTARADRIDLLRSGRATLIDYKSGTPPGPNEVKIGLAPQLTLEAAILIRGGFEGLGNVTPERALYLKLGGADGGRERLAQGDKGGDIVLARRKAFRRSQGAARPVRRRMHALSLAPDTEIRQPLRRLRPSGASQGMVGHRRRGGRYRRFVVSRRLAIPEPLRKLQAKASDPRASAWVSANAGSGKTHVLTQRVLRLLLAGTPPGQILGLTFTKAAAANMATRIFNTLAKWTSLNDKDLAAAIAETGATELAPQTLKFARQLFARTIETPGGLKIQTLHAFCERLLQLFPFEANVPAHFRVIDESEAEALMREARDQAIVALRGSPGAGRPGTRGARRRRLQVR